MVYRTTPKMRARKEARRRRLLDVGTRLFAERGFHGTTVPRVVAAANSSIGSFYLYFANKEDLFASVLQAIGERLAAHLNDAIARQSDPLQQMSAAVESLFLFFADNPREARVLIVESSGLGGRLEELRRELLGSHALSVESALRNLPARTGDPVILARCWVGAVYEAVRLWLEWDPSDRPAAVHVAREVARFNLRGIGGL
jgi:AcrR family transcriptional regulator